MNAVFFYNAGGTDAFIVAGDESVIDSEPGGFAQKD